MTGDELNRQIRQLARDVHALQFELQQVQGHDPATPESSDLRRFVDFMNELLDRMTHREVRHDHAVPAR
jgi:hypothetical protein